VLGCSALNMICLVDLAIATDGPDWPAGSRHPWLTSKATGSTLGQRRYLPRCRTRGFPTSANFESELAIRALTWSANSGKPRSFCICLLLTYHGAPIARRRHLISFYLVRLVGALSVIGQNKLTCNWPDCPVAWGLKRAVRIFVGCSHNFWHVYDLSPGYFVWPCSPHIQRTEFVTSHNEQKKKLSSMAHYKYGRYRHWCR
jgi:hypothetical protein